MSKKMPQVETGLGGRNMPRHPLEDATAHDPRLMAQKASPSPFDGRPINPEGLRGEAWHTIANLIELHSVQSRIYGILTGEYGPDIPHPDLTCAQERAKFVTDMSNAVLHQARVITEHLRD